LEWTLEKDKYRLKNSDELQIEISLTSGGDYTHKEKIRQSNTNVGSQVLGAWLAPDGNNSDDLKILCAKGAAMSRNVAPSKLSQYEVTTAYEFMLVNEIPTLWHNILGAGMQHY
jgi:hypothetical protein